MATEKDNTDFARNALKLTGEALIPGGSNFVKGDLKNGALFTVLGLAARCLFGLPGLLVVSAASATKAVTGRHLHEHLGSPETATDDTPSGTGA